MRRRRGWRRAPAPRCPVPPPPPSPCLPPLVCGEVRRGATAPGQVPTGGLPYWRAGRREDTPPRLWRGAGEVREREPGKRRHVFMLGGGSAAWPGVSCRAARQAGPPLPVLIAAPWHSWWMHTAGVWAVVGTREGLRARQGAVRRPDSDSDRAARRIAWREDHAGSKPARAHSGRGGSGMTVGPRGPAGALGNGRLHRTFRLQSEPRQARKRLPAALRLESGLVAAGSTQVRAPGLEKSPCMLGAVLGLGPGQR